VARRCYKSHPDKKIMTLVYHPTETASKKIDRFPPNLLLQMAVSGSFSRQWEVFGLWKDKREIYAVWLYWFGAYQIPGISVKLTPRAAAERIRFLHQQGVKMLYWGLAGAGENWGNEGPVYYAIGQLLHDPYLDYKKILKEYYEGVYGDAAPVMEKYFTLLYHQLDTNYLDKLDEVKTAEDFFTGVYPPEILERLESLLLSARRQAKTEMAKGWLALTEDQFTYIKTTAGVFHQYRVFEQSKNRPNVLKLKELIEERNRYIERLAGYADARYIKTARGIPEHIKNWYPGYRGIQRYAARGAIPRGWCAGFLGAPFAWNFDDVEKLLLSSRTAIVAKMGSPVSVNGRLDDAAWKQAMSYPIGEMSGGKLNYKTTMKLLYDERYIYVGFECEEPNIENMKITRMERDDNVWQNECIELLFDIEKSKRKYMHFVLNPREGNFYDARKGYIPDQVHPLYSLEDPSWNPVWRYASAIDKRNKRWIAEVRIPFATLGMSAPEVGTTIRANFGRERHLGSPGTGKKTPELSLWAPNYKSRSFGDPAEFGVLHFGNLVPDPGFEEIGRKVAPALGSNVSPEKEVVHSGDYSLRHEIPLEKSRRGLARTTTGRVAVEGGSAYRIGLWINIPKDIEKGKSLGVNTGLQMLVRISGKKGPIRDDTRRRYQGTDGWFELYDTFQMPPAATSLSVTYTTRGSGKVYLDDASILNIGQ